MGRCITLVVCFVCAGGTLIASPAAFGQVPTPVGLWEFEDAGDLGLATIGADLVPDGTAFTAGPGVSGGDGAVTVGVGDEYVMTHGIAAVGGDTGVNRYTLLFDFRVPTTGVWYCFFQTESFNLTDGDYFISPGAGVGVADLTYSPNGTVVADTWYRLVFSMDIDEGGNLGAYTAYFDGTEINSDFGIFGTYFRYSLQSTLLLFADQSSEDNPIDISNVAMWDFALSDAQAAALGAAGDPIVGPAPPNEPQIPSNYLYEEGDRLELDVPAPVNEGLPIQWLKDMAPLVDGGSVSGSTTATLVIDPLVTGDSGDYSVTYDDGTKVATMAGPASVLVLPAGSLPAVGLLGLVAATMALLATGCAFVLLRRQKRTS